MTEFNLKHSKFDDSLLGKDEDTLSVGDRFISQEVYDESCHFKLTSHWVFGNIPHRMTSGTYLGWENILHLEIKGNIHQNIDDFGRVSWTTQDQFESENISKINDFISVAFKAIDRHVKAENIQVNDNYDKYVRPKSLSEFYARCAEEAHYLPLYELVRNTGSCEVEDLQTLEGGQITVFTLIKAKSFADKLNEHAENNGNKIIFEDFIAELFDDSVKDFFPNLNELYAEINIHKLPRKLTKNTKTLIKYWLHWKRKEFGEPEQSSSKSKLSDIYRKIFK